PERPMFGGVCRQGRRVRSKICTLIPPRVWPTAVVALPPLHPDGAEVLSPWATGVDHSALDFNRINKKTADVEVHQQCSAGIVALASLFFYAVAQLLQNNRGIVVLLKTLKSSGNP